MVPELESYRFLLEAALKEDLGSGDITSQATIPPDASGTGALVFRQEGILCGMPIVQQVLRYYDTELHLTDTRPDGDRIKPGQTVGRISGNFRSLLAAERVVLNFLQHLSAIATQTDKYVQAVAGTGIRICDTRKTTPGWRQLDKYAVLCGGGTNHRCGLYDAVLIKDNHLALFGDTDLSGWLEQTIQRIRNLPQKPEFIEVEVDTLEQLRQVLQVDGVDIILLDNMPPDILQKAVHIRNELKTTNPPLLEASGGITLENIAAIARTGIERISVGALTHSVQSLDIGLDIAKS